MPVIHIQTLPYQEPLDMPRVLADIGRDFAEQNGLPLGHVHTTWAFFQPGHYAKGEDAPACQPDQPHNVLVDLLTPDFNDADRVERMLTSLAASISRRAGVPIRKIFINHRAAHSGMVFDDGQIVRW